MRLYGWDDTGPYRGELLAARVDSSILKLGLDCVAGELGWESAFTSYQAARAALLTVMRDLDADEESIQTVNRTKAGDVPEVAEL